MASTWTSRSRFRRTFAKSRSTAVKLSSFNEFAGRGARDAPSVFEGGRAAPRRGLRTRRAHHPRRPAVPLSHPVRRPEPPAVDCVAEARPGAAAIAGRVLSCGLRSTRRPGFKIFDAVIDDGTASIRVSWLNQAFLRDVFARGQHVVMFGQVEMRGSGGLQLTQPAGRNTGRGRRQDDSHRPHCAGVREGGQRHAENAAAARGRCPAAPAGGTARSAPGRCPHPAAPAIASGRAARRPFSAG